MHIRDISITYICVYQSTLRQVVITRYCLKNKSSVFWRMHSNISLIYNRFSDLTIKTFFCFYATEDRLNEIQTNETNEIWSLRWFWWISARRKTGECPPPYTDTCSLMVTSALPPFDPRSEKGKGRRDSFFVVIVVVMERNKYLTLMCCKAVESPRSSWIICWINKWKRKMWKIKYKTKWFFFKCL